MVYVEAGFGVSSTISHSWRLPVVQILDFDPHQLHAVHYVISSDPGACSTNLGANLSSIHKRG